ncbi:cold-shock protein [Paenibacillus sp. LHD-38]|uniref:cold-shock protein n=1 Tax=Paenibacillus sp. LHD-38 TaxID=3072143 RepID=UPI00280DDB77|nr:cold-shock protein [Paenibacillus sp. LHD-38]MDQ8737082.1 cold-shock protein [Paenibacillus sp. LHD-38]
MYFRRKSLEDHPQENTIIWTCQEESCTGWIRDDFAFDHIPACFQCHSPMVRSEKMLISLNNSNKDMKSLKPGKLIS